jgi:pyruvate dehydrogenase E2 component (dihydrolipoamide acetyltransferase)
MEEGVFVGWLKSPGVMVQAGEPLFELETDKATQPVEAVDSGRLCVPSDAPAPGATVRVGTVLGFLMADNETMPESVNGGVLPPVGQRDKQIGVIAPGPVPLTPAMRRHAREAAQSAGKNVATVIAPPAATRQVATPRARRAARELGMDWRTARGTGRDGRICERDVRATLAPDESSPPQTGQPARPSARRRTIAARMLASHLQTAPVTLTTRADAVNLVSLRRQFKSRGWPIVPTVTDLIVKLAAETLSEHPQLAAVWQDDALWMPQSIDIGFAVDTGAGLLVPVIRAVRRLPLGELARQSSDLAARARDGKLTAAEMAGGAFTVSNLGVFGIDAFTPIIQPPQTAILGIGAIRREPVARGESVAIREQMTLSLTFDHRAMDGAPAARFLRDLVAAIENPAALLIAP